MKTFSYNEGNMEGNVAARMHWTEEVLEDVFDIILSNEDYVSQLLNDPGNRPNDVTYGIILSELQRR